MNERSCKTCVGCIWADQCGEDEACDDYTPLDEYDSGDDYLRDLQERKDAYQEIIDEYSDGMPLSDGWWN